MSYRILSGIALGGVAAAAIALFTISGASGSEPPTVVQHNEGGPSVGPTVVAIGDSIMEGHGLDASQAWPALLAASDGWQLTSLASDGSGFVTMGDNRDTFADQLKVAETLHPDLIILSGSSNDLGVDNSVLAHETATTIDQIRAALPHVQVLAVSTVWGDTSVPDQISSIDADVRRAIAAIGGSYVNIGQPLSGRSDLMQPDDVHPTAAGQFALASDIDHTIATQKPASACSASCAVSLLRASTTH